MALLAVATSLGQPPPVTPQSCPTSWQGRAPWPAGPRSKVSQGEAAGPPGRDPPTPGRWRPHSATMARFLVVAHGFGRRRHAPVHGTTGDAGESPATAACREE